MPSSCGAHVLEHPRARLRPVDFAALRIKLPPVLSDEADADEIDGERLCDELGVDPVFHRADAPRKRLKSDCMTGMCESGMQDARARNAGQ